MSTKQKVLHLTEPHGKFVVGEADIPEPGPGEVLVEIRSTALNPVDWKIQALNFLVEEYPAIVGSDSAGVVAKVGAGVTRVAIGDKVLHQGFFDNRHGTFQQYVVVEDALVAKIPDNLTFDQAATIPVALATAAIGLYKPADGGLGLTAPWAPGGRGKYAGQPILIIGGSSSVGQYAIQLAKLSGFSPIITTASEKNAAYVKSLGATHVVDRGTAHADLCSAVATLARGPLNVAFDAISERETQNAAVDALAPGGRVVIVLPSEIDAPRLREGKAVVHVLGNVQLPAQREFGRELNGALTGLLAAGDIKPNHVEVLPYGLAGIPAGLERLQSGKVSAVKLVARPQETV